MSASRLLAAAAALALSACVTAPAASPPASASAQRSSAPRLDPQAQRGREFAQRRCSGCHNVGLDDGPPYEGPAFRNLALRYNALSLERRFAEISAHGMSEMPPVEIPHAQAEELIAYLDTLHGN